MLCMPSPSRASNEGTLSCWTVFRKKYSRRYNTTGLMSLVEMPMQQQTNITRNRSTKICTTPRFPFILREMQREFNMNRQLESRLHIDYSTNNHHSQLRSTDYPDCCFVSILSGGKRPGPRIMRKLWSNTRVRRVRKKEQAEDSSYPKGSEVMLRDTFRKSYPENVDNPMTASRDYEV